MSEEMIKNLIARLNHNCSNACLNDASSCICTVNDIKDLIHLYNKEKEKNKELEEKNKELEERNKYLPAWVSRKYISKDKIEDVINNSVSSYDCLKENLETLLYGEDCHR